MFLSCPFLKERYHMNKSEKKKKKKLELNNKTEFQSFLSYTKCEGFE